MSDAVHLAEKTVRTLARIHPGFRFLLDEREWVVFCRDGTWQSFDSWPGLRVYVEKAMRRAKVPTHLRYEVLQRLVPAMQAGPPIAVANRDNLPRNPFLSMKLRLSKAAARRAP